MINFDDTKQRLLKLNTACICDADKILKFNLRVMDSGMRPIRTGLKLVGYAHTVTCHNDFLTVVKALRDAAQGEVQQLYELENEGPAEVQQQYERENECRSEDRHL